MNWLLVMKVTAWFALLGLWCLLAYYNAPAFAPIVTTIQLALGAVSHNLAQSLNMPDPATPAPAPIVVTRPVAAEPPKAVVLPAAPAAASNP
jgi:hypothetical protein